MRKIFVLIFLILLGMNTVYAENVKNHYIHFGGNKYDLLYSTKSPDAGGYLNEYYKVGESYHMWSEMVAVHHFPNAYSPINQVKEFKEYLNSINCPSSLTFYDKKNSAIIDFIMIDNSKLPVIMEFNVFKYQRTRKSGSMALQYAKRYAVKTAFEAEDAKKDFEKHRKSVLRKIKHYDIPALVYEEIDKCKLAESITEPDKKAAEKDNQTEIGENENTPKIEIEDILTQEAITVYKAPQFTVEEKQEEENVKNDLTKTEENNEIPEKYKQYNDILNHELFINYKRPEYVPTEEIKETEEKEVIQNPIKENSSDKNLKQSEKKKKKQKAYEITNSKDDFYAKPLTKKEIKQRKKQLEKEHSEKYLKQRVKKASKKLNEQ